MIEINLLPGPKKKKAGAGFTMPNFGELAAKIKDPLLIGAVAAWVLVGTGVGLTYTWRTRQVTAATDRLAHLKQEKARYDALITQRQKADSLRIKLVAEIAAIRSIDGDRYVWPHVLEEVTKALPDYTWLVDVEFLKGAGDVDTTGKAAVRLQIEGRTSDIEAYTRFVRQLSSSPWLTNIVVGAAQTVIEEDRPVTAFTITAQYHEADMAYKRTVPLRAAAQ